MSGSKMNHFFDMPARTAIAPDLELKRQLAASILRRMEQDNLSISALAERIGTGRTAVRRILDAKNTSITFRSMCRAAHAVGLKIKLIAEPMSPDDLDKLAHRLSKSKNRAESAKLTARITEGFYAGS
jgi:predicted XRE-type DNA-binding protein